MSNYIQCKKSITYSSPKHLKVKPALQVCLEKQNVRILLRFIYIMGEIEWIKI